MTRRTISLRRLTSDWKNPDFDKRRRYGVDAVAMLPVGTKILVRRLGGRFGEEISAIVLGIRHSHRGRINTGSLLAISEPCDPESWNEWRLLHDDPDEGGGITNAIVLKKLWERPELRDAISAAFTEAMGTDED